MLVVSAAMTRNTTNLVVDFVTFLVALGLVTTGLLMEWVLPPGSGREGLILWGWDRHDWGEAHFWLAITAIGLVILHLALHWTLVCSAIGRMFSTAGERPSATRRNVSGVLTVLAVVALIGGLLWIAAASVTHGEPDDDHRPRRGRGGGGGRNSADWIHGG